MTDVSKYTVAIPTRNQEAQSVIQVLVTDWFSRYTAPERIHSVRVRDFESFVVKSFFDMYGNLRTILTAMGSSTELCIIFHVHFSYSKGKGGP